MTEKYSQYLLSGEWQKKRLQCFASVGNGCEACGEKGRLQCHHLTYERIFAEDPGDLMALCEPHHDAIEEMFRNGKIVKIGDPKQLRKKTMELLCSTYFPKVNTLKTISCEESPKMIQDELMKMQDFVHALNKDKKKFKKIVKTMFSMHPNRNRILSNAHEIFEKQYRSPSKSRNSIPNPTPSCHQDKKGSFEDDFGILLSRHKELKTREIVKILLNWVSSRIP